MLYKQVECECRGETAQGKDHVWGIVEDTLSHILQNQEHAHDQETDFCQLKALNNSDGLIWAGQF